MFTHHCCDFSCEESARKTLPPLTRPGRNGACLPPAILSVHSRPYRADEDEDDDDDHHHSEVCSHVHAYDHLTSGYG